jgi:hypothetical protein
MALASAIFSAKVFKTFKLFAPRSPAVWDICICDWGVGDRVWEIVPV